MEDVKGRADFLLVSGATIFPAVALTGGLMLIAPSVALATSRRFWSRALTKLTENGFVQSSQGGTASTI